MYLENEVVTRFSPSSIILFLFSPSGSTRWLGIGRKQDSTIGDPDREMRSSCLDFISNSDHADFRFKAVVGLLAKLTADK